MNKRNTIGNKQSVFWSTIARIILRNRTLLLLLIALATLFLGYQARDVRFTHTEANLLPDNHPINKEYTQFLETFGEEGNLIVIGVKDSLFFTSDNITAWNNLTQDILSYDETATVISLSNLKTLQKDTLNKAFVLDGKHHATHNTGNNGRIDNDDDQQHAIF